MPTPEDEILPSTDRGKRIESPSSAPTQSLRHQAEAARAKVRVDSRLTQEEATSSPRRQTGLGLPFGGKPLTKQQEQALHEAYGDRVRARRTVDKTERWESKLIHGLQREERLPNN
ncbi:hypothetical protein F443_10982 [Phytophthora nicotianae P1569]|uniref:Uncharacterized protein n=1 Tax=Phytophthora nicotianae P1569 TaxID=1317065 RepID=V9EYH6_PHYNI|nr:hypothetical protein F443_10982 [Phytophthora nicotianae P1569]